MTLNKQVIPSVLLLIVSGSLVVMANTARPKLIEIPKTCTRANKCCRMPKPSHKLDIIPGKFISEGIFHFSA